MEDLDNGLKKYTVTKTTLTKNTAKKSSASLRDGKRTVTGKMGEVTGNVAFDYKSLKTLLPDFTIAGPDGTGFNDEMDIAKVDSNFLKDYDKDGKYFQWLGQLGLFSQIYIRDGEALTTDESNMLTDGMALLATQAAIWRYGNSGQSMLGEELQMPWGPEGQKADVINKTYHYLIGMEGTPATGSNTLLQKDVY